MLAGGGAILAQAAPSDRIVMGVIGSGSRGTFVMTVFQKDPAVGVAAICDVYEPNLERALSTASKAGSHPKAYRNYKQLLADKDLQAVLIATPEHWHHQIVLDALAAGKDVYVEKPLCQTPEQGRELVEAEKKSKNIVQVGMQRRSYDLYLDARKVVAEGTLGNIRMVRSWWLNNDLSASKPSKLDGPLDWEQWQGPARKHEPDPDHAASPIGRRRVLVFRGEAARKAVRRHGGGLRLPVVRALVRAPRARGVGGRGRYPQQ